MLAYPESSIPGVEQGDESSRPTGGTGKKGIFLSYWDARTTHYFNSTRSELCIPLSLVETRAGSSSFYPELIRRCRRTSGGAWLKEDGRVCLSSRRGGPK